MLDLALHPQEHSRHILDFLRKIMLPPRRRIDYEEHTEPQFPSVRGKQLFVLVLQTTGDGMTGTGWSRTSVARI